MLAIRSTRNRETVKMKKARKGQMNHEQIIKKTNYVRNQ